MQITSLPQYRRDGKRFVEITSALVKYGFASQLHRIEPEFVRKWLGHESLEEVAKCSMGERLRLFCEDLGPTFVKLGQVLSTRPDVVPPDVAHELEKLQSGTPADPPETVRAIVEEELGAPIEELFAEFDLNALASASIGQVHAARLADGRSVVVKVQHPGIEDQVNVDFDILSGLAGFLEEHDETARSLQIRAVMEEARRTLNGELDFRRELRSLEQFGRAFADNRDVHLPDAFREQSSRRVLTMERLEGFSVADEERLQASGFDRTHLAEVGAHVFLDMVFRDGAFHADPHPGNVFVLLDGRVGLIDFGMVGRIDDEMRDDLLDLLVGFSRADSREIGRVVRRLGTFPAEVDEGALRRDIADLQGELAGTPIGEMDVGGLLEQFTAILRRHRILLPPAVSMLVKLLVMLEGTARHLDPRFSLMGVVKPYCETILLRRASPKAQAKRAFEVGRDWIRLIDRLPSLLDDVARRVEQGKLKIDMVHTGLEATVDRLVSGLLCASLLVGGALLWSLKAPPVIYGIPVVGVAATGLAMVHGVRILRSIGRRPR
ncbi:MAG: AarF/ABC1/UbiB kinase family protein [Planctomycetota bacterium]